MKLPNILIMECDAAVVLILRDDGKFLVIKRADQKGDPGADIWHFPADIGTGMRVARRLP